MPYGRITGWATNLPDRILTNDDLAQMVDTSDEWITARTGVKTRHIDGKVTEMSTSAALDAMAMAGVSPDQIDLLLLATTSPDQQIPASASVIQHSLGLTCGAFDLNAACSGFVYGLVTAMQFIQGGMERILVIGSDSLSSITNWEDRGTCILFGDGAGAFVVENSGEQPSLLGWDLMSDGEAADLLYCEHGDKIVMDGQAVFRKAVLAMEAAALTAMDKANVVSDEIKLVVPHQANIRIIEAALKRLDIPMEKAAVVLSSTGNTSAASIPLAFVDAVNNDLSLIHI